MTTLRGDLIQAVPLIDGKINIGPGGPYEANGVIHAEEATELTLHLDSDVAYSMEAGADRGFIGSFSVASGLVTYE